MPKPKTRKTTASVKEFIAAVPDEQRRKDAAAVLEMMGEVTGEKAAMWGPSIVGFGSFKGPTGDWPVAGFSPRKAALVLYMTPGFDLWSDMRKRLGPHSTGVSCLYVKRLSEVDTKVLRQMVEKSVAEVKKKHKA